MNNHYLFDLSDSKLKNRKKLKKKFQVYNDYIFLTFCAIQKKLKKNKLIEIS